MLSGEQQPLNTPYMIFILGERFCFFCQPSATTGVSSATTGVSRGVLSSFSAHFVCTTFSYRGYWELSSSDKLVLVSPGLSSFLNTFPDFDGDSTCGLVLTNSNGWPTGLFSVRFAPPSIPTVPPLLQSSSPLPFLQSAKKVYSQSSTLRHHSCKQQFLQQSLPDPYILTGINRSVSASEDPWSPS